MSGDLAEAFYSTAFESVHRVESTEIAEAAKILENVYRSVNIALVNEMKVILEKMDIDIWKVVEAASSKPFGFQPFYPGPGHGGHCIPIDPFYLAWKAQRVGCPTRFIELAGEINTAMPAHVVAKVREALEQSARELKNSKILVLGVAYKPDVNDTRETPAAEILTQLRDQGADIAYHDPHVPKFPRMRRHDISLQSRSLTVELLREHDCVVIVTDHAAIDWQLVSNHARLIVDTRNVMSGLSGADGRVWKA